jgi:hypothetical protein
MKKIWLPVAVSIFTAFTFVACKKEATTPVQNDEISQATLSKIKELGFGTSNVLKWTKVTWWKEILF